MISNPGCALTVARLAAWHKLSETVSELVHLEMSGEIHGERVCARRSGPRSYETVTWQTIDVPGELEIEEAR